MSVDRIYQVFPAAPERRHSMDASGQGENIAAARWRPDGLWSNMYFMKAIQYLLNVYLSGFKSLASSMSISPSNIF